MEGYRVKKNSDLANIILNVFIWCGSVTLWIHFRAQGLFMDPEMATFPDDTEHVSVFVSAVAHPDFIYVQMTANKDR